MYRKLAPLVLAVCAVAWPAGAQTPTAVDPDLQAYVKPGTLADVGGGRRIHLLCMGKGSPTVILSAGLGNWAETWRKIQPRIAKTTRVCAWDRAGWGFSSPSPEPQDVVHTTADLEKALRVARIGGPYVLVGHSLAGYESLLFADRNPRAVKAMVLVDPSFPDQVAVLRKGQPAFAELQDRISRGQTQRLDACIDELRTRSATPDWSDKLGCLALPPDHPEALKAALLPGTSDPARWLTRKSLIDNVERDSRQAVNPARRYGAMPLIVLTASQVQTLPPTANASQEATRGYEQFITTTWRAAHDDMAGLSTCGENRVVAGASHYIQLTQPEAVVEAIGQVLAQARSNGRRQEGAIRCAG